MFLNSRRLISLTISIAVTAGAAFAASGDVDAAFNPQLTIDLTANYSGNVMAFQPDGKIIVAGRYELFGGSTIKSFFKRLNPDGSTDPTFNCPACISFYPKSVAIQSDGKIIVGGSTGIVSGQGRLIRVNPDGSTDFTFNQLSGSMSEACEPYITVVQTDGKILIKCNNVFSQNNGPESIRRLESNGSIDTTFPTIQMTTSPRQYASSITLLSDGKILIGGGYTEGGGWLNRYNTDGSIDSSFQANPLSGVGAIDLLPDGRYLVLGAFSNGSSTTRIARLFTNGTVDPSFSPGVANNEYITGIKALPNGQFYVRLYTDPYPLPGNLVYRFVRYNADASVDNTFSQTFLNPGSWGVDALNRIVTFRGRFYRLNTDGNVDATFNPSIVVGGFVTAAALQTDGKVLIAGEFGKTNGTASVRFTRVNSDGTTDATFNSGTGFDVGPHAIAIQSDGKILASGGFTFYNGTARTKLVRINADGSLDAAFNPTITGTAQIMHVYAITPLANGKILIGGNFTTINGTTQVALARLNADGSLDAAFNPVFGTSSTVYAIFVQPGGKMLAGGGFGNVNGVTRGNLARLNSDGSLDTSFSPTNVDTIGQILQRTDGKYIVSFKNTSGNGNTPSAVVLLNNNGVRDFFNFQNPNTSFANLTINAIYQQPNGNVLFGGLFSSIKSRYINNIARLGPSGEMDIFFPQESLGANYQVNTILGQPDGKIIVAGEFSGIEDVGRSGIARLTLTNRIRGTLFDFDGDARADISVFRPSTNVWYELLSSNGSVAVQVFGANGDVPAPADYDGDGKTDLGVFRPSLGDWLYVSSLNSTVTQLHWGATGDIPRPSDVNGDGKADLVVYRPSTSIWWRFPGPGSIVFGIAEDKPLIGDFDGDAKDDPAIFRPSTGVWWYAPTTTNYQHHAVQWGVSSDIPVPADYDGDRKTDFAVYRPSNGVWYIANSSNGSYTIIAWGLAEDKPVAADYDGDGRADIAVFRPSTGIWYLLQSTAGFGGLQWGVSTDVAVPNAFVP